MRRRRRGRPGGRLRVTSAYYLLEVTLDGSALQHSLELLTPFRRHLLPLPPHLLPEIILDFIDVLLGVAAGVRSRAPAPLLLSEHVLPAREVRAVGSGPPRMLRRSEGSGEDVVRAPRHERTITRLLYLLLLQ